MPSEKMKVSVGLEIDKSAMNKAEHQLELFKQNQERRLKKFEIGKFSSFADTKGLDSYRQSLNSLTKDTPNLKQKMQSLSSEFANITTNAQLSRQGVSRFSDEMSHSFQKFTEFYVVGGILVSAIGAMKDMTSTVYEMDNALTEFRLVTMSTDEELTGLTQSMMDFAKANAVTVTETAKVTTELARQGLSGAELDERREAIVKFAKISGLSFQESEKAITASANGTKESVQTIIDVYATLGDKTASGADELAIAVSRTASAAKVAGYPFKQLASDIAVVSSVSRESASTIGQSFKSIIARYGQIKESGFADEGGDLNQIVKALRSIGISATDSAGQLRPFGEVIQEVSAEFPKLDRNTQAYIATALAGSFQSNRMLTLLTNQASSMQNLEWATNSAGSANQKFSIYLESADAKVQQFKASVDSLWINTLDSGFLKSIIDSGTSLVGFVDDIGLATVAMGLFATKIIEMSTAAALGVSTLRGATIAIAGMTAPLSATVVGVGLLATGLFYLIDQLDKTRRANLEVVSTYNQEEAQIKNLAASVIDLKGKQALATDEQERLHEVYLQLKAINPAIVSGLNEQKLSYDAIAKAANTAANEQKKSAIMALANQKSSLRAQATLYASQEQFYRERGASEYNAERIKQTREEMEKVDAAISDLNKKQVDVFAPPVSSPTATTAGTKAGVPSSSAKSKKSTEDILSQFSAQQQAIKDTEHELTILSSKLSTLGDEDYPSLTKAQQEIIKSYKLEQTAIAAYGQELRKAINSGKYSGEELQKLKDELAAQQEKWWGVEASIEGANKAIDGYNKSAQDLIEKDLSTAIDKATSSFSDLSDIMDESIDSIDDEIDALKRKQDALDAEYDRKKLLLEVEEARAKLSNVLSERNVKLYTGQGITGWEFVADPQEVQSAQEDLNNAKEKLYEFDVEASQKAEIQKLEDEKKALEERKQEFQKFQKNIEEAMKNHEEITTEMLNGWLSNLSAQEQASYATRIAQVQAYVQAYNAQLAMLQSMQFGGGGGTYDSRVRDIYSSGKYDNTRIGSDGLTDATRAARREALESGYKVSGSNADGVSRGMVSKGLYQLHDNEGVFNAGQMANVAENFRLLQGLALGKTPSFVNKTMSQSSNNQPSFVIENLTVQANNSNELISSLKMRANLISPIK